MRSTLSALNRAEIEQPSLKLAEFAEFAFPGGTIRVTAAPRDLIVNGNTFRSNGMLLNVSPVPESADLKARRVSFLLSAVDSALLARLFADNFHYARSQLWLGLFDESWRLIDTPLTLTDELLMSGARLTCGKDAAQVELSVETWELFNRRDSAALATSSWQQLRYPGDTGQDAVNDMNIDVIEWGGFYQRA